MLDELNLIGLENFNYNIIGCNCPNIGLVDWNFDVYYCNQTRIKIGSILNDDNSVKTLPEIISMITPYHGKKVEYIKKIESKCKKCEALYTCRLGCYYNTFIKHHSKEESK
jgi:radical SAM protein with 4Fe4S-binding SPASM domain